MTRIEFENTLNDITRVDLSGLGSIHPSMANSKETFYIKNGKYCFKIESGAISFDCGVRMPDVGPNEEISKDYIEQFCETVKDIGGYAQSTEYIADMAAKGATMSEEDNADFMANAFMFRILLTFAIRNLEQSVAERCL